MPVPVYNDGYVYSQGGIVSNVCKGTPLHAKVKIQSTDEMGVLLFEEETHVSTFQMLLQFSRYMLFNKYGYINLHGDENKKLYIYNSLPDCYFFRWKNKAMTDHYRVQKDGVMDYRIFITCIS